MNQPLLSFEQAKVDADQAAAYTKPQVKLAAKAHAIQKRQTELDKMSRCLALQIAARERMPGEHAQCGIRWYCRSACDRACGNYWDHCHACGQPLIYTSDPNTKPQECKPGRR